MTQNDAGGGTEGKNENSHSEQPGFELGIFRIRIISVNYSALVLGQSKYIALVLGGNIYSKLLRFSVQLP